MALRLELKCVAQLRPSFLTHTPLPPLRSALSFAATLGGYGPGKFSAATTANTEVDGTYAKSTGTALFTAPYGRASVFVQDSARPILTTLG